MQKNNSSSPLRERSNKNTSPSGQRQQRPKSRAQSIINESHHSLDRHPAVHASLSPKITKYLSTSPSGAPLRKQKSQDLLTKQNLALNTHLTEVMHSNIALRHSKLPNNGLAMASPFTPRNPSRLRISANSPLRASASRDSNLSTSPLSSPGSTSPLSRAGASSFNFNDSPANNILSNTQRTLDFTTRLSPPNSPKSLNDTPGSNRSNRSNISNKTRSSNVSNLSLSDPFLASEMNHRNFEHMSSPKRSSPPKSLSPSNRSYPSNDHNYNNNHNNSKNTSFNNTTRQPKMQPKITKYIKRTPTKPNTSSIISNSPVFDWKRPALPLTNEEKNVKWQFDLNTGQPKIISAELINRSKYMVDLFDRYDRKCVLFLQQQESVREVTAHGSKLVDRRKAQVVALNMTDMNSKKKREERYIENEINEDLTTLQRLEDEKKSLEKVLQDQQRLIHQLTYT